ncbi:MAG: hypothetical protein J0I20_33750 [Chloroflexi bacterium]|nr:hypothetical protein [Chloroflexota bacterium]
MRNYISNTRLRERVNKFLGPDHLTRFAKRISLKEIYLAGPIDQDQVIVCKRCQVASQDCEKPNIHRLKYRQKLSGWETYRVGMTVIGQSHKIGVIKFIGRYDFQHATYPCVIKYRQSGTNSPIRNIATLKVVEPVKGNTKEASKKG